MTPATLRRKVNRLARPRLEALIYQWEDAVSEIYSRLTFGEFAVMLTENRLPDDIPEAEARRIAALEGQINALDDGTIVAAIRRDRPDPPAFADQWPDARIYLALPEDARARVDAAEFPGPYLEALRREAAQAGVSLD